MSQSGYGQRGAYNSSRDVSRATHPQTYQDASAYYKNTSYTPSPPQHAAGQQSWQTNVQSSPYQSAQSPYRPRPSPTPSGGSGENKHRFCPHGASFDCGYGCHANTNTNSPSSHGSPNSHYSPSPNGGAASSSNPSQEPGGPGHASLPSRMAPGPNVEGTLKATYLASSFSPPNQPQGVQGPPYGDLRYAGLPNRMASSSNADSTSNTSLSSRRG
jgi:hypothetical protein